MSTVADIEAVLPNLSAAELLRVERAVHKQVLERASGVIYDDAYGVMSEADLIASADKAFLAYDKEEAEHARPEAR